MAKLRQVQRPGQKANWTEFFYSGELKVVQNETETDNLEWINQLKFRGFEVVGEEEAAPVPQDMEIDPQLEETIHNEEPFEPLGTQVVDEQTEIPDAIGEALMPSDYSGDVVDATIPTPTEDVEGDSVEQPSRPRRKAKKESS